MKKKLWLAVVSHEIIPGTRIHCFHQKEEPKDRQILRRAALNNGGDSKELSVDSVFDLNQLDAASLEALVCAVQDGDLQADVSASDRAPTRPATSEPARQTSKAPSVT